MDKLFYQFPALEAIRDFLELGGDVLFLIAILTAVMWALIFERLLYFSLGHRTAARTALACWEARKERTSWYAHMVREQLISIVEQGAQRNLGLIKSCVALCPLMGLLGTVTGMVEVFEVMAISGSGNPRSMAAGVSKATVSTLAGMVIAISGLLANIFVERQSKAAQEHLSSNFENPGNQYA